MAKDAARKEEAASNKVSNTQKKKAIKGDVKASLTIPKHWHIICLTSMVLGVQLASE